MRTLKGISTFIVLVLLLQGCMPDSLTKFKEDSTKKEDVVTDTTPPDLLDPDGNPIEADTLTAPVSISYSDTVFIVGTSYNVPPGGTLNDLEPTLNGTTNQYELAENMEDNFNSSYAVTPALPTGLTLNTVTGAIFGSPIASSTSTTHTMSLTYTDPVSKAVVVLNDTFNVTVEEEISTDFRTYYNTTVGAGILGLNLADNTNFQTGVTNISNSTGSTASIVLTDTSNNIFVSMAGAPLDLFKVGDIIDNASPYVSEETSIAKVSFYYQTNAAVDLIPYAQAATSISPTNGVAFEISPDLPTGLTLNTTTGAITGTVTTPVSLKDYTLKISNNTFTRTYDFGLEIVDPPRLSSYSNNIVLEVDDVSAFRIGSWVTTKPEPPAVSSSGKVIYIYKNTNSSKYLIGVEVINGEFKKNQFIDNNATYYDQEAIITEDPEFFTNIVTVNTLVGIGDYKVDTANGAVICQGTNAKGVVTKKVDDSGTGNRLLFIQQSRIVDSLEDTSFASNYEGEFSQTAGVDTLTNVPGCDALNASGGTTNITDVWSQNINLDFGGAHTYEKGMDVIAGPAAGIFSTASASAYVSSTAGRTTATGQYNNTNSISITSNVGTVDIAGAVDRKFIQGLEVEREKPFSTSVGSNISAVRPNVIFELTRGEETLIKYFNLQGEGLVFEVSPNLPSGLTLNSNGDITGTPLEATALNSYTIRAKNVIGEEIVHFDLRVNDYFSLEEISGAPSYILHKTGQLNSFNECKINKDDIETFVSNPTAANALKVDKGCFLEVGESDLYNIGLKFKSNFGPGICEFVTLDPFEFYKQRPTQFFPRNQPIHVEVGTNSCTAAVAGAFGAGTLLVRNAALLAEIGSTTSVLGGFAATTATVEDLCPTDCSSGLVSYRRINILEGDNPGVDCHVQDNGDATRTCSGGANACRGGSIESTHSATDIANGLGSYITNAFDGGFSEYTYKSPRELSIEKQLSYSNKYLVNYIRNNSCTESAGADIEQFSYEFDSWNNYSNLAWNSVFDFRTPSNIFNGRSPYYTFSCLDSAHDIKARIRVLVRDWDRDFGASAALDSFEDPSGLMDVSTSGPFSAWNNHNDWDNERYANLTGCSNVATPTTGFTAPEDSTGTPGTIRIDGDVGNYVVTLNGASTLNFTEALSVGMEIRINGTDINYVRAINNSNEMTLMYPVVNPAETTTPYTSGARYVGSNVEVAEKYQFQGDSP